MPTQLNTPWIRRMMRVALLGVFILFLAVAFQALRLNSTAGGPKSTPENPPPTATDIVQGYPVPGIAVAQATQLPQGYPGPLTSKPAPANTVVSFTPIVIVPGQTPIFPPTETPWPTAPYPPTPTRRPGPSPTAISLVTPANSAAGVILYSVRDEKNKLLAVHSLPIDAKGKPSAPPKSLKPDQEIPEGILYPSPDGSRIIIEFSMGEGGSGFSIYSTNSGKVDSPFRGNSAPTPTSLFFLGWHPDNRHVLFGDGYMGLLLVDTDTGEYTVLFAQYPSPSINQGAVSPNGQRVVFSFQKDDRSPGEVWMINLDGSDPHQLFTIRGPISAVAWAPDGDKIAYVWGEGLGLVNVDGSNYQTFNIPGAQLNNLGRAWSPNSRSVVFTAWAIPVEDFGLPTGNRQLDIFTGTSIFVANVDTGGVRPVLVGNSVGDIYPSWSPDGSQIAFVSLRNGRSEIWAVNADGSDLRQLTNEGAFVQLLNWR